MRSTRHSPNVSPANRAAATDAIVDLWPIPVAALIALLMVIVALVPNQGERAATQTRLAVAGVIEAVDDLAILEWRAVAGDLLPAEIPEAAAAGLGDFDAALRALEQDGVDAAAAAEVTSVAAGYREPIERLFALLAAGDAEAARDLDERLVDPAYDLIHDRLRDVSARADAEVAATTRAADVATVAGILAIALIGGVVGTWVGHRWRLRAASLAGARSAQVMADRWNALVQHSGDVFLLLDAENRITEASASVRRVFGYAPRLLGDRRVRDFVHPADVPTAAGAIEAVRARSEGEHMAFEARIRAADGRWLHLDVIATNLVGVPGVDAVVLNGRDVSDRRRLHEEVRHLQKMEVIGRLVGGVAHDFNNVLAAVGGYTELTLAELDGEEPGAPRPDELHPDPDRDARLASNLHEVLTATDRARALTRQLLAFGRRQPVEPATFDAGEAVAAFEPMLSRFLGEQHPLRLEVEPGGMPITADRTQFEQVVLNLAVNARDAMPDGGAVRICVCRGEAGTVRLSVIDAAADTDGGLPDGVPATADAPPGGHGTGLNLSVADSLVGQLGGRLDVATQGRGTMLTAILPSVHGAPASAVPDEDAPRRGRHAAVLVVEDEDSVRELVRSLLERAGHRVVAVAAPEAARDAAGADRFDLLLTDVVLPNESGPELAAAIRTLQPDIRLLYMSGYSDAVFEQFGVDPATVDLLHKPFTMNKLLGRVERLLADEPPPAEGAAERPTAYTAEPAA